MPKESQNGVLMEHTDPVCGMKVGEDTPFKSRYGERTIYFCSDSCKRKFDTNPEQYKQRT